MPDKILLVDDDEDFRREFRYSLDEYEVIEASSGLEALQLLKKPNEIDLVILDVMMPGLSGTEVLKEIKNLAPELGIIILTGFSSKEVAVEALKGHADDYIEKPLDIEKTKEIIEHILAKKRGESYLNSNDIKSKIERVKHFVQRNFHKKVSLKDAAVAVCLSPKYLSRVFKQNTGMGFSRYKLAIKVKKAKEFLKKTGWNIEQISDRLGYQNIESFIRIFKKFTVQSPTEFRKKNKVKKKKIKALRAKRK
jgi:YesN/AraC family two-component response regulator